MGIVATKMAQSSQNWLVSDDCESFNESHSYENISIVLRATDRHYSKRCQPGVAKDSSELLEEYLQLSETKSVMIDGKETILRDTLFSGDDLTYIMNSILNLLLNAAEGK